LTPNWSTAVPDWQERIVRGDTLIPFPPLFPEEAEAALEIFRTLKLVDVAGGPTIGEVSRPWLMDFAAQVFGSYDAKAGRRLIRYFFLLISKKNAKSTLAAGVMLTALLRNWRKSGEYYILAPTKEVADNSYGPARDMVNADEELQTILRCQDNFRTITHRNTGAFLKVVAADSEVVAGKKTIGLFVDELWLFGKRANARTMLQEAMGGLVSRPEGFVIFASTQSDTAPAGVFKERLERFRKIRDGKVIDNRSLGVLYEYPPAMIADQSYKLRENRYITNPNIDASVDHQFLDDQEAEAKEAGSAAEAAHYAKHANVEVGVISGVDGWAGADHWEKRADPSLTLETLLERSEVAVVGIDGGGLDDLLGVTVIGREKGTRRWLWWSRGWAHECVLQRRKEIAPRLLDFQKQGDLWIIADDSKDDIKGVVEIVEQVADSGILAREHAIGVDAIGIVEITNELSRKDFTFTTETAAGQVTAIRQGYTLSNTIASVGRALAAGDLVHAQQPITDWSVGNARLERKGNAVLITKEQSGVAKIDLLMAGLNGCALMAMNPEAGVSVFDAMADEDEIAGNEAQSDDEESSDDQIDMTILRDPSHPKWQEMRERFESKISRDDEDFF
jgi:phage terminase large subunit-like protein